MEAIPSSLTVCLSLSLCHTHTCPEETGRVPALSTLRFGVGTLLTDITAPEPEVLRTVQLSDRGRG